MTELYAKLNLPTDIVNKIKRAALVEMQSLDLKTGHMHFLTHPALMLNEWLVENNLPRVYNCILFHRPANAVQPIHNDCNSKEPPEPINCAINIPIENCEDSYMEWFQGSYTTSIAAALGKDGITRKHINLEWNTPPKVIDRVVIDAPYFVNVSVPHRVTVTNKTRSLVTFRFIDNPSYDRIRYLLEENNLLPASVSLS